MEIILLGLATSGLTYLSDRLKVSKTIVSIGLSLIFGAVYYVMTTYYSQDWKTLLEIFGGIYASSQIVYNLINKYGSK